MRYLPYVVVGLLGIGTLSCRLGGAVRTSADATSEQVTFLELPVSARRIRFWDDGHNRIAAFSIEESEFLAMFRQFKFEQIKDPVPYISNLYGNAAKQPWVNFPDAKATDGLIYERIAKNGGGVTIIYDRISKTAFFSSAKW